MSALHGLYKASQSHLSRGERERERERERETPLIDLDRLTMTGDRLSRSLSAP